MENLNTLPPDFDPQEFAPLTLLEQGDVDVWVRRRGAILLEKSRDVAKDCEASKLASALTIGASVVMSANPLAWLPLTIGALGYVYTVFQEFQDTGSIRLIPMYRGKLGDILNVMEGNQATQRHPLEDQIEYLSEAEKDEALLINYRFGEIASILSSAPPRVRFDLYRHVCGQFHARRDLVSGDEVKHYITNAVSEARRAMPPVVNETPTLPPMGTEALEEKSDRSDSALTQAPLPPATPVTSTEELPPRPFVLPQTRDELIEALAQQCPALLGLVKSHPLRVVGVQRSGKTTLVKILALLRVVLIPGHNVIASTPHYEVDNEYPDVFRVVGLTPNHKRDYPAIRREWSALANRIHESLTGNTTTIWDEFGVYEDVLEEDELSKVLTSCLRETMKFGEYPIFIVHGETQAFLPGSKGLVQNFLHSTVRVETIGEKVRGADGLETIRPTGKFKVRDLDKTQTSGQIPQWLTEEFLLQLVGNTPATPKPQPSFVNASEVTEESPTLTDNVPVTELKVSDSLIDPLKTIWLFAKEKNDWVTSKEIYQKSYACLKRKGVKEIRQYLGLLADSGYGEIDEEGKSDSAVAFRAY